MRLRNASSAADPSASGARKAFRKTRQEMGSVNAELQESISAVREVQAFNRAEENIQNFRTTNAANRDANVRAVAFTSALAPTLEDLVPRLIARQEGRQQKGRRGRKEPSRRAGKRPGGYCTFEC